MIFLVQHLFENGNKVLLSIGKTNQVTVGLDIAKVYGISMGRRIFEKKYKIVK